MARKKEDDSYNVLSTVSHHGTEIINFDDSSSEHGHVFEVVVEPGNEQTKTSILEILKAWLCLTLAVLSGAAIGPMFKYMNHEHIRPALSASWRCQCMTIFLVPLGIIEATYGSQKRVEWFSKTEDLPYAIWVHIAFAAVAWAVNLLSWIFALQYLSTGF